MRMWRAGVILGLALALGLGGSAQALPIVGVEEATGDLYEINPTTGACTLLTSTTLPLNIFGACTSPNVFEIFATPSGGSLYTCDVTTGTATAVGAYSGDTTGINGLAYDVAGGTLYGTDYSSLYTINPSTAATSLVGPFGSGVTDMWAMTYVPGDGLYGVDQETAQLYTISAATGAATAVGASPSRIIDIAYDPATGVTVGSANTPMRIYDIDLSSGAGTLLNDTGVPSMLGIAEVQVPEPATVSLLGLGGLALLRRRRRRS